MTAFHEKFRILRMANSRLIFETPYGKYL